MAGKNPLSQLASLGEEAFGKLAQNPTTHRAIQSALQMKDRVDDLSKRVRGLEAMDKRFASIERRLDKLEQRGSGDSSKTPVPRSKSKSAGTAAKKSASSSKS